MDEYYSPCLVACTKTLEFMHLTKTPYTILCIVTVTDFGVCCRIVALLTPNFLEDKECLEQFNMAMCCNRRQKKEILYPFYIKTVEALPSYMSLVQYIECR